jgi:hypothetical protein
MDLEDVRQNQSADRTSRHEPATPGSAQKQSVRPGLASELIPPDVYEHLRDSLDALKEETVRDVQLGEAVVGSAVAVSTGLSVGYVVWMIRGGSLLASVLSSMPAWQLADPLPILAGTKDEDEDEESLETIIKKSSPGDDKKEKESEPSS